MKGDGGREWRRDEDGRGEGLLRTEGGRKNRGNDGKGDDCRVRDKAERSGWGPVVAPLVRFHSPEKNREEEEETGAGAACVGVRLFLIFSSFNTFSAPPSPSVLISPPLEDPSLI